MATNTVRLPEPESGTKRQNRPRPILHLAILRCLVLWVVIGKCELPATKISQENGHGILIKCQFVAYNYR